MDDYLLVLKAVEELPFNVGRKLLCDVLNGQKADSVMKNNLHKLSCFGSVSYTENELDDVLDTLIGKHFLEVKTVEGHKYWKVLSLTEKGKKELKNPQFEKAKKASPEEIKTSISQQERTLFEHFDFFLKKYNDEQKKAIVCNSDVILCIAGAGSGKTTVLTKRIEFLAQYRSVNPKEILAITFTRKAKKEMEHRLSHSPYCNGVVVETFNSFSEQMLKKYNNLIYGKPVSVMSYGDKMRFVGMSLKHLNLGIEQAMQKYFSSVQQRLKTNEELQHIFVNDCFSILDYYKNEGKQLEDFSRDSTLTGKDKENAKMMFEICEHLEELMEEFGKRDFSDQVIDCVELLQKNPRVVPHFEHVLIDEYQDVNAVQMQLIDLLNPKHLFCVGDPRQAIFGWRGSNIEYILKFKEKYKDAERIALTTNYRSADGIVKVINSAIKTMNLPDLHSALDAAGELSAHHFEEDEKEFAFVVDEVKKSEIPRNELFVLARTNRTLLEISQKMQQNHIDFVLRSDEIKRPAMDKENAITLATIHAIKGLEAKQVFVVGCQSSNFPCRTSDHPVMDLMKREAYDKEEEERRLFYVALSRAKEKLVITFSGNSLTKFATEEMKKMFGLEHNSVLSDYGKVKKSSKGDLFSALREWRRKKAMRENVPAYMILNDATLQEIAESRPLSLDELEDINGFGPTKLRRYGKEVLAIVMGN